MWFTKLIVKWTVENIYIEKKNLKQVLNYYGIFIIENNLLHIKYQYLEYLRYYTSSYYLFRVINMH